MAYLATCCLHCAAPQAAPDAIACGRCGGPLGFSYDLTAAVPDERQGSSMWRFWRRLPVPDPQGAVTLGEGGTPLIESRVTTAVALAWKDETRNPTGSHKDRALSLALTHALRQKARMSLVVSAGSTGLSNAAYAARAGLAAITLIPAGAPEPRLYPLSVYGARLIEVAAGIDELIEAARGLHGCNGIALAATTRRANPVQSEAAKTIAYEIVDQCGDAPDWVLMPTGGGGSIAALWRGFLESRQIGAARGVPRLAAIVPNSHDALAAAFRQGIADPGRFAALAYEDGGSALLAKLTHAHPPDGLEALAAVRESCGTVVVVDEAGALEGTRRIAARDGLYLEPSSGVLAPGLDWLIETGAIRPGARVIGVACGGGFRETFALAERAPFHLEHCELADLRSALL